MKKNIILIARALCSALTIIFEAAVCAALKFDKKVLKAYLGVETPIYKCWWSANVRRTQKLIDRDHFNFN